MDNVINSNTTIYNIDINSGGGQIFGLGLEQDFNSLFFREEVGINFISNLNKQNINMILKSSIKIGWSFMNNYYSSLSVIGGVGLPVIIDIPINYTIIGCLGIELFIKPLYISLLYQYSFLTGYSDFGINYGIKFSIGENIKAMYPIHLDENNKKDILTKYEIFPIFKDYYGTSNIINVEFSLIDYPYNFTDTVNYFSMKQSLELSKNISQSYKKAFESLIVMLNNDVKILPTLFNKTKTNIIGSFGELSLITYIPIIFMEYLYSYLPTGYGWVHEEWHRAVLKNRGIDSYDEIYDFKIFSSYISVSHIKDEDLIRLKANYPADMVRLSEAGNEANLELGLAIGKDSFFGSVKLIVAILIDILQTRSLKMH